MHTKHARLPSKPRESPPEPSWLIEAKALAAKINAGIMEPEEYIASKITYSIFTGRLTEDARAELIRRKILPKEKVLMWIYKRYDFTLCEISFNLQLQLLETYLDDFTENDIVGLLSNRSTRVTGSESEPSYKTFAGCPNELKVYSFITSRRPLSPDARFAIGFNNRNLQVSREGFTEDMNRIFDKF